MEDGTHYPQIRNCTPTICSTCTTRFFKGKKYHGSLCQQCRPGRNTEGRKRKKDTKDSDVKDKKKKIRGSRGKEAGGDEEIGESSTSTAGGQSNESFPSRPGNGLGSTSGARIGQRTSSTSERTLHALPVQIARCETMEQVADLFLLADEMMRKGR